MTHGPLGEADLLKAQVTSVSELVDEHDLWFNFWGQADEGDDRLYDIAYRLNVKRTTAKLTTGGKHILD